MRIAFVFLFLVVAAFAQGSHDAAPSACGPKNVNFEVTLEDSTRTLAEPEPGKATVYFIQDDGPDGNHQHATVRIGLDGAWVGAYKHNSYFAVSVSPGDHHICANVQSELSKWGNLALAHFTAETGKVYYFRTQFLAGLTTMYPIHPYLELEQPDSDQAVYLIASFPVSTAQPKK